MRIIYIIGAARSGTTLLDIVLGNQNNVLSAGELNRFSKRLGIPHSAKNEKCSSFWIDVNSELDFDLNLIKKISQKMEYHSSFFKLFGRYSRYDLYKKFNISLFKSISQFSSNKNIIVDSSKYPMRAFYLSKIFSSNISFIYIKRNPLNVVDSFTKDSIEQPSKSRFKAHLYLLTVNFISSSVLNKIKNKHLVSFINYEDLCNNPFSSITKIESDLKMDFSDIKVKLTNNQELNVGCLFDGNRLRLRDYITIKPDQKKNLPISFIDRILLKLYKLM